VRTADLEPGRADFPQEAPTCKVPSTMPSWGRSSSSGPPASLPILGVDELGEI
jgi:hypothetical protein